MLSPAEISGPQNMSPIHPEHFQQLLLNWFDQHGRKHLPWQQDINAYRVWVSEIMLQQTQVSSVIDYFKRFMSRFPDVYSLANAEIDIVLQHWAGLGYYARARNLHRAARTIVDNGGEFPRSVDALTALPGIGKSTAGAILSIAFGQRQPILDGNVKRVLARFHAIHGWPGDGKIADHLWQLSDRFTPAQRNADYTQAIMDLGATLCTRSRPRCSECPVATGCLAMRQDLVERLPEPKPRKSQPIKHIHMLLMQDSNGRLLLEKRPPIGIWGGLWSLPEFDDLSQLVAWCQQRDFRIDTPCPLPSRQHSFSHFQLDFVPVRAVAQNPNNVVMEADGLVWYKARDIEQLGLPAPIKRLLQHTHPETLNDQND